MRHGHRRTKTVPCSTLAASKSLLIEGWRTTNHSYALVNQYQIAALRKLRNLRLFHLDMPFCNESLNIHAISSGFSPADRQGIDRLTTPGAEKVDCAYRIFSPFRAYNETTPRRTVTFIVTEIGLHDGNFTKGSENPEVFMRNGDRIVTASCWSRDRLVEWGFSGDKIDIIPHGVDRAYFQPLTAAERVRNRNVLGIGDDEILFLNVGAAIWTKGTDILLLAFAYLRLNRRKIRLILRDRSDMYGVSAAGDIAKLSAKYPGLFNANTIAGISIISDDLTRDQMRALYGAADCYVSPYRAEGFNLPVLESIACGTPVIVTRGGATDDFCNDSVALRIRGTPGDFENASENHRGRYITPDLGELVEAMDCLATRQNSGLDRFDEAREALTKKFSWHNAALQLAKITVGHENEAALF